MRVLLTTHSLSNGGAEFVAAQWARYLARMGDQVTLYTTHPEEKDAAPDGVSLVKARNGNVVAKTRDLARYLNNHPVDIVVAVQTYCNLISIAAARGLGANRPKVVISEHTLTHGPRMVRSASRATQRWLGRRIYRYADLIVAVSHPVGAEAIAEYGLSWTQVSVVPNPAYAKVQERMAYRRVRTRDPDHLDIVVPARLVPLKRPLIAVDVAATLSSAFPGGVTLHFFGVGPLHDQIVTRARAAGVEVVMRGWVGDWFDECPAGSVVLLTSIVEGCPTVLIEAAGAGFRSVVSSRALGAADAILPGLTGELIVGDSVEEYAAAILATAGEAVHDVEPWLQRFTCENSGGILRDALVRTANGHAGNKFDR